MAEYDSIYFDSCFLSNLNRIDPQCELIEWFVEYLASNCFIAQKQYEQCPCKTTSHTCKDVDSDFDHAEILDYWNKNTTVDTKTIFNPGTGKDIYDLVALYIGSVHGCTILSCDKSLLNLCGKLLVSHRCFKSALYDLHKICGDIYDSGGFDTAKMFDPQKPDPFFNYLTDTRCQDCNNKPCVFEFPGMKKP